MNEYGLCGHKPWDKSEEYLFSSARDYEHDKKCESLAINFTTE
jgi:hypothetical protein